MRRAVALGLACALASGAAHARPFTVEDLLGLQDLGRTAFSPDGRWLVLDVEAPWKSAGRFDLDAKTFLALGRPMVVDLQSSAPARDLLLFEPGAGYSTGAFSPDGTKVVVFRQTGHRLDLGVVTLATGKATWTGLSVDTELFAPAARWLGPDRLLVLSREPEDTRALPRAWIHQVRSTQAWAAQAVGDASGVALGSGRFAAGNPAPPRARLVVVDLATAKARVLASGPFVTMILSPDRARAALISETEAVPIGLSVPSLSKSSQRRRLALVDLTSGRKVEPCPTCDLANIPPAWSRDSRQVLAAARRDGDVATFGYWRFAFTGLATPLAPSLATDDSPGPNPRVVGGATWLGDAPTILAKPPGGRFDWWRLTAKGPINLTASLASPAAPAIAASPSALMASTPTGPIRVTAEGKIEPLAPASARLDLGARLAGDPVTAAVVRANGAVRAIWPTAGPAWVDAVAAGDRILDVLPERGLSAVISRDAYGVRTVTVRDRAGAGRKVLTLNADLAGTPAATPQAISHRDPAGRTRTSWLYLPPGGPKPDTPLIVVPYPGAAYPTPPSDSEPGVLAFSANTQILTSAGYAVLVPSLPIDPGAEPSKDLAASILMAIDAARAQAPFLSATRLALWGQSFGGWGALMTATQTDRFKAVIATSPITDLFTFYGQISPQLLAAPDRYLVLPGLYGWSETGQGQMGVPPWRDVGRYLRNSPALLADKITAPVMLVTSDSDFTSGQSPPLFGALYRQGKDAQLILYRGEGHVVLSPGNVRDLYARALAFLAASLGPPTGAVAPIRPSQ